MRNSVSRRRPGWRSVLTVALALGIAPLADAQVAQVGSKPEFRFSQPLVNGLDTTSLADLQGKLVWVEFWGTH